MKNFDLDLLDNIEEFIDRVFYTSTPSPNTIIDYIQRLEKYAEKVNSNGQKYNLESRNKYNVYKIWKNKVKWSKIQLKV